MKKIFFILLLLIPAFAYAQATVELTWPSQVALWQPFDVQATLTGNDSAIDISNIDIKWKENFELRGTSTQTSFQSINGKSKTQVQYTLSFVAKKEGSFTLWPVQIFSWTWVIKSGVLNINVWQNFASITPSNEDLPHDIFGVERPSFPYGWVWLIILVLVFLIAFYFFLSRYLFQEKIIQKKEEPVQPKEDLEIQYIREFQVLASWISNLDKNTFYWAFNETIRRYFEEKGLSDALTLTYDEIETNHFFRKYLLDFAGLFARSYREEFTDVADGAQDRQKIILEVIEILKRKIEK